MLQVIILHSVNFARYLSARALVVLDAVYNLWVRTVIKPQCIPQQ